MLRLVDSCFEFCVHNFEVSKLDVDEQVCVDRCAFKYNNVYMQISDQFKNETAMMQLRGQLSQQQAASVYPQ